MGPADKRGRLDDEVFSYREGKDGRVFISWHGRIVTTLRGMQARRFLASVRDADRRTAQLAMARVTGNFKRSNERPPSPNLAAR